MVTTKHFSKLYNIFEIIFAQFIFKHEYDDIKKQASYACIFLPQ